MAASLPLIRKLHALSNRIETALKTTLGSNVVWYFDPLDAVPWFEKWVKIREELMVTEPELDDIPPCVIPEPSHKSRGEFVHTPTFEGRGYIRREVVMRMMADINSVRDVLNHPSRQVPQVSIDREGIFVAGQPFDALLAVTSIIRAANSSIVIVDGYVSDHTLSLLGVKKDSVAVRMLTKPAKTAHGTSALVTAAKTFNAQYAAGPPIELRTTAAFHDRFVVIDDVDCYHFGASIKDAAAKAAFMFSKIEESIVVTALNAAIAQAWSAPTAVLV